MSSELCLYSSMLGEFLLSSVSSKHMFSYLSISDSSLGVISISALHHCGFSLTSVFLLTSSSPFLAILLFKSPCACPLKCLTSIKSIKIANQKWSFKSQSLEIRSWVRWRYTVELLSIWCVFIEWIHRLVATYRGYATHIPSSWFHDD